MKDAEKPNKYDNPFYDNHIFSKEDLKRCEIRWWEYPFLYLLPTYVQIAADCNKVFYYKHGFDGRYYLMKVEDFGP